MREFKYVKLIVEYQAAGFYEGVNRLYAPMMMISYSR